MIYLVDDDQDDLELVQEALIEHSYKGPVLTLTDGKMLIDRLNTINISPKPDVIVLDLNMPLLNGFQALQAIRKHPVYSSVPVIILTASTSREDEIRCFDLGCDFFLSKPSRISDYATLTSAVKNFVSRA